MKHTRLMSILALAVAFSLLLTGVVYAITITVDGIKESAWDGQGSQTPGVINDDLNDTSPGSYDLKEFRFTNDTTNMYFLVETADTQNWEGGTSNGTIRICIDYKTGGSTTPGCSQGLGSNTDAFLACTPYLANCQIRRWNGSSFVLVSGGTRDVAYQESGAITEFAVDIASLMEGTCYSSMNASVYYDNGDYPTEDFIPGSGSFTMSCGSPTAVRVAHMGTRPSWPYFIALSGLLAGATLILRKRR